MAASKTAVRKAVADARRALSALDSWAGNLDAAEDWPRFQQAFQTGFDRIRAAEAAVTAASNQFTLLAYRKEMELKEMKR